MEICQLNLTKEKMKKLAHLTSLRNSFFSQDKFLIRAKKTRLPSNEFIIFPLEVTL